ncbi:hypothetical protein BDZ91DRAFT_799953 [Kalaharituber pfeilii]|nr:hypothetical protein BDZ91DRAFT_799953 [Kalaharituber pfeilii]
MCDDLLARHHLLSAASSIPLSSNPTWFTTQSYRPTDPPRGPSSSSPFILHLPSAATSTSPASRLLSKSKTSNAPSKSATSGSTVAPTTVFDYFPAFFEINKRWSIYAFDKSAIALYPTKADRCEMVYEMVYSHAHHHPAPWTSTGFAPHGPSGGFGNSLGVTGYSGSNPGSRSPSPGPLGLSPASLAQSYELVEDEAWFRATFPSRTSYLAEEKCLSIVDVAHPGSKRAGYLLLMLPTALASSGTARLYIPELIVFPEYRGAGAGAHAHLSLLGRGLVRMLLQAVIDVAGDLADSLAGSGGVDIWMNVSAEQDPEVLRTAVEMGWEVNRPLWLVERNNPEEDEEQEFELVDLVEEERKKRAAETVAAPVPAAEAATASSGAPSASNTGAARTQAPPAPSSHKDKEKGHWRFGEWGKGMKGWRERWVKALEEISHGKASGAHS